MDNKSPQRLGNSGENGMSMKEYNVVVGNTKEKEEVQELFEKLGYEKDFFMDSDYPRCVVTQESNEKWVTTGMDMGYATGKRLTIQELKDMVHPQEREYLNKTTGEYRKTAENVTGEQWVEIPDGSEIAILFNKNPEMYGVCFYKEDGKQSKSEKDFDWRESRWYGRDLSHKVLWQRHIQTEELPFIGDEPRLEFATRIELDLIAKRLDLRERYEGETDEDYRYALQHYVASQVRPCITDEDFVFTPSAPLDTQVGGNHYKDCAIQPVEFAMKNNLDFCQASAIKYIVRHASKNGKQDLEKAKHFIDLLIQFHYD